MALSFLGSGNSSSAAKLFDIRLDDDYIVFRGGEHEASSAHLRGKLILCLSEPLRVQYITLHLTGASKISWLPSSASTSNNSRKSSKENSFFDHSWTFVDPGKTKTQLLQAGNYEYDFDIVLDGGLPESVEGLPDTWLAYRFRADIGRGLLQKDIHARKHLRIVRTLDPSALELAHAMSVENVWPNKIEYSISTPSKAVVFGTSLDVNFRLVPLMKGLRIGKISTSLVESHDFTVETSVIGLPPRTYKKTRTIQSDEYEIDAEGQLEILDEEAEGYQVSRALALPKTLNMCLQDTEAKGIKVRHKLKFTIQLHNPDGHVSELRATLPVTIFISPSLPIDDNNNLVDQSPLTAQRATDDMSHSAPPLYGEHQFDQLYSDVDPSGYFTPAVASETTTPYGTHSRNISDENLASLDALTNGNVPASALRNRLENISRDNSAGNSTQLSPVQSAEEEAPRRSSPTRSDYFGANRSNRNSPPANSPPGASGPISRRTSEEDNPPSGTHTPRAEFVQIEDLCRVPSYSTAVKANPRTPLSGDLPNYQTATRSSSGPSTPQPPRAAHLRSGWGSPPNGINALNLPDRPPVSSSARRYGGSSSDDDRRIVLMQDRARA